VQSTGRIDDDNIRVSCLGRLDAVVGHRGRIGAVLLLDDGDPRPVGPDLELLNGGGTKGVCRSHQHALARLLVLVGHLADGRRLADAVYADHHNHVERIGQRGVEISGALVRPFKHQPSNFVSDQLVQLLGRNVLLLRHPGLDVVNNVEGRVYPHIARDEDLLKLVQDLCVNRVLPPHHAVEFPEKTISGFVEPFLELLLLVVVVPARKLIEKAHGRLCS